MKTIIELLQEYEGQTFQEHNAMIEYNKMIGK